MCRLLLLHPKPIGEDNPELHHLYLFQFVSAVLLENTVGNSNRDGCGFYLVEEDKLWKTHRPAPEILREVDLLKWLWSNYTKRQDIIAHVRAASVGGKGPTKERNSHPFILNNLVLAHNGTLGNYDTVKEEMNLPEEVEVDSEILLHKLSSIVGNRPFKPSDLQRAVDQFTGSGTFIIADKSSKEIFLCVGSNPLYWHENDRVGVANTESLVGRNLDTAMFNISLCTGLFQKFSSKKLADNTIYKVLDGKVEEVGEFKIPPTVSVSTAVVSQTRNLPTVRTVTTSSKVVLSFSKSISRHNARSAFLDEIPIGISGLIEVSHELSDFFPGDYTNWSEADFKLLTEFFKSLDDKDVIKISGLKEKREEWLKFLFDSRLNDILDIYAILSASNIEFLYPYFLNDLNVISSLPDLIESFNLEEDEVPIG